MADSIVIVSAARTAVGSFNGVFGNLPAHELGAADRALALKPDFVALLLPAVQAAREAAPNTAPMATSANAPACSWMKSCWDTARQAYMRTVAATRTGTLGRS